MATLLFPDFLDHPESYDAAEIQWKARFDALAASTILPMPPISTSSPTMAINTVTAIPSFAPK